MDGISSGANWTVEFTARAAKQTRALPSKLQAKLVALVAQIQVQGPVRGDWPNYSKLGGDEHHCHLNYRHVVCWRVRDSETRTVEIYYAGKREDAPY